MVYSLQYRRPERVERPSSRESISGERKQMSIDESIKSGSSGMSHGIPEALSFDRIISGGTCPVSVAPRFPPTRITDRRDSKPCTTRDFMNYLKYIELAAENLQFHLWLRSYRKRFDELPESEKALSPAWAEEHIESETPVPRSKTLSPTTAAVFAGTDFASQGKVSSSVKEKDPFFTPPRTPASDGKREAGESMDSYEPTMTLSTSRGKDAHAQRATNAFEVAGLKWKPRES